jgi:hypothetical protein
LSNVEAWSRDAADELIGTLARERDSLEALLFRLTAARHLLQTGSPRFLARVAHDIERTAELVREAEWRRVDITKSVLGVLGEPEARTMRELVERAPDPYRGVLDDHRSAMGRLAAEVGAVAETAHELARQGRARLEAELKEIPPDHDDPLERALQLEVMLSGYDAILGATSPLVLPALSAFLS